MSDYLCDLALFFFKQKTAYEMRISDWSSYVCSSDLVRPRRDHCDAQLVELNGARHQHRTHHRLAHGDFRPHPGLLQPAGRDAYDRADRESVVSGKSVSVRVDLGGRRIIKNK